MNKGQFKKGHTVTEETREKISNGHKNKTHSFLHIKNQVESRKKNGWFKNLEESSRKISLAKRGILLSEEHKRKISLGKRGIATRINFNHPEETRKKMSEAHKKRVFEGRHNNYKGGITSKNKKIRKSLDFKLWREAVFERDNYTCVWCKQKGGRIHPDHIKMFAFYPDLRFEISNGQTLCENCHAWKTKWDMIIYTGKVPELNII